MAQQGNADPEILKRFKWMLRDKNLTQMELSERLNFSRTYVSSIVVGRSEMSGSFLRALAFDGWNIQWILTGQGKDQRPGSKSEFEEAIQKVKLAEEKIDKLEFLVDRLEVMLRKPTQERQL